MFRKNKIFHSNIFIPETNKFFFFKTKGEYVVGKEYHHTRMPDSVSSNNVALIDCERENDGKRGGNMFHDKKIHSHQNV